MHWFFFKILHDMNVVIIIIIIYILIIIIISDGSLTVWYPYEKISTFNCHLQKHTWSLPTCRVNSPKQ